MPGVVEVTNVTERIDGTPEHVIGDAVTGTTDYVKPISSDIGDPVNSINMSSLH